MAKDEFQRNKDVKDIVSYAESLPMRGAVWLITAGGKLRCCLHYLEPPNPGIGLIELKLMMGE